MANEDLSKLKIDRSDTAKLTSHKRRSRLMIKLVVIAALVLLVIAYFRSVTAVEVESATVTTAYPSQSFTLLNATGYVVAQRKAAVASKATGRVEWLGVTEGSKVKKGEIIARLESKDVTAAMEQAAANVKVAEANLQQGKAELIDAQASLKRTVDLLAKSFISQAVYDRAAARNRKSQAAVIGYQAAIDVAQASHRAAQISVEHTMIRAPFDGVVLTKSANIGDVVTPFSSALDAKGAVVTMADMDTLEVEADVSESNLQKVKIGQPCEIQLDALPAVRLRGVVQRIVPTVDRAKATILVKVRFIDHNPNVLPEMSAKIAFLEKEMSADQRTARTVVQPDSITQRNGKKVVFLIKDEKVVETLIETGKKIGDMVEVLKGPKPGDKIVLRPGDDLDNGDIVKTVMK
ncbi:MAG: efflux RND transporter periplasmic adaptor subunit [Betaproteobacteria bacterium]|nr:MAG: efflux RND transporter periplasmic adaptor subunit [Betaproteobacteria bacterium]